MLHARVRVDAVFGHRDSPSAPPAVASTSNSTETRQNACVYAHRARRPSENHARARALHDRGGPPLRRTPRPAQNDANLESVRRSIAGVMQLSRALYRLANGRALMPSHPHPLARPPVPSRGPAVVVGNVRRRVRSAHGHIPYQRLPQFEAVAPAWHDPGAFATTSGLVAHKGHERSTPFWPSGRGRWARQERDPAHRPVGEQHERHLLCCTAVSSRTGIAIYLKLIVPFQIDLAMGDRRYWFDRSARRGPPG